eukprot:CAMPEP_0173404156 /NCGR_PEP_ID=MMETSP1356-20130122/58659_1 /TAXON_ID=77927 ORGANISM="Hemiselmis virescens, Strain PCC157" /NCGR_SAMPLE_ID=MMETSP1356 /ASSEMBLY_ACC=CAM_ASM_000847 /LENGTH=57 /DNA_ID=CAMNT_0014364791 /DNA_START=9 /DNA_END=179 /DNA_ORIENTATION=-
MTAFSSSLKASSSNGTAQGSGVVEWDGQQWLIDGRLEEDVRNEFLEKMRDMGRGRSS